MEWEQVAVHQWVHKGRQWSAPALCCGGLCEAFHFFWVSQSGHLLSLLNDLLSFSFALMKTLMLYLQYTLQTDTTITWLYLAGNILCVWQRQDQRHRFFLTYRYMLFASLPFQTSEFISHCVSVVCWRWILTQELQCVNKGSRIINSVLEGEVHVAAGAVVQHCHLQVSCLSYYLLAFGWNLMTFSGSDYHSSLGSVQNFTNRNPFTSNFSQTDYRV